MAHARRPDPSSGLAQIDHIVVLMLENRSFDNLLGQTFEPGVERVNRFFPFADLDFTIPIPAFTTEGRGFLDASIPTPDPGELFQWMHQQIYGLRDPLPVNTPVGKNPKTGPLGPMGGFVQNYLTALEAAGFPKLLLPFIMHGFTAEQMPVTTTLGKSFAVVDRYFGSAPCQTLPNRCFAQLGTAQGFVNNKTYQGSYQDGHLNAPYVGRTIFNDIDKAKHRNWRVYFGDFPLTLLMADTWPGLLEGKFHFFDRFAKDVAAGTLPSYSWIEPNYQLFPTDNHPPHDVNLGELLLSEVYNTLRANTALWEKTLLIVTYDEHGGCYDHVFPPPAEPPEPPAPGAVFDFNQYGPRIPALLLSPYIPAGTVGDPAADGDEKPVFDHTSILATVRETFGLKSKPLSQREAAARDFGSFLTLSSSDLNLGPESVSVGLSREVLERQAIEETVSELGQLIWEYIRKQPATRSEIKAARAALKAGTFDRQPAPRPEADAEVLDGLRRHIRRIFGREPVGLLRWA